MNKSTHFCSAFYLATLPIYWKNPLLLKNLWYWKKSLLYCQYCNMKNCAVLKNILFAIEKNASLLKNNSSLLKPLWYGKNSLLYCQYCNMKNCAVLKNCCYWKIKISLLKKMLCYKKKSLRYCKQCLAIEKILCCWQKSLRYWKKGLLLKHLWHQKNICYIVNIVIKLGAYLHSEVHFCPHSRCQILWERCLFSMA